MKPNAHASMAVSAYQNAALTVSPAAAIVLAFDKSIVRLQRAILAIEARRLDEAFSQVNHVAAILRGLSHILNFDKGGPLADQLFHTYGRIILALFQSFGKPDAKERYRTLIKALGEMREAWSVVVRSLRSESPVSATQSAVARAAPRASRTPPVAAAGDKAGRVVSVSRCL